MMLKPVKRQSLSDAVFVQLRDQIVSGDLEPGTALPAERVLCEMLEVNRGALREAIKRLEQARLVSVQQGGATRVLDFRATASMDLLAALLVTPDGEVDTQVARSLLEMRSAIAPDMARLAALRGDTELADELDAIVRRMGDRPTDLPELQALALEFWDALACGSRNVAYRLAFNAMRETYEKIAHLLTQILSRELSDTDGYRAVAAAVRAGEADEAEERAREMIGRGADRIYKVLRALDRLKERDNDR